MSYTRYKHRNMYIENTPSIGDLYGVASYSTLIGYIDWENRIFLTWGYSRYSVTTSRQITQLCREQHLHRVDIADKSEIYKYHTEKGL